MKCPSCGAQATGGSFCSECGVALQSRSTPPQPPVAAAWQAPLPPAPSSVALSTPWYYQKWFVVVMILFVFPVGLILLWKSPVTRMSGRIIWSTLIAFALLGAMTNDGAPPSADQPATTGRLVEKSPPAQSSTPAKTPKPAAPTVDEIKAAAVTLSYDDLARDPLAHKGKAVVLKGEVIQVAGSTTKPILRVNVTDKEFYWTDTIWVNAPSTPRVLEEDIVQLWGTVKGEREYTALLGNSVRVPEVDGVALEVLVKAGDR